MRWIAGLPTPRQTEVAVVYATFLL
eukprot:SAG31_NODE_37942_length_300_cov_0.771144_1_plen_24_part_01